MEIKLLEIRDAGTFIAAMAIHLRNRTPEEFFLLRRAGYAAEQIGGREEDVEPYIILCKLDGVEAQYDPFAWSNQRTMGKAHWMLISRWKEWRSGDVIDVEYELGERPTKKMSEARG